MLPGRTEDAVKIRWKSLCRVRKGQGRRAQSGEKGKASTPKNGGVMMVNGMPPHHMMHHPHQQLHHHQQQHIQMGSFSGPMVKSEDLGGFSNNMRAQQAAHMNRMQYANAMSAQQQQQQAASMGYHVMNPGLAPGNSHSMLYASDMGTLYDPTTGQQYRKPQQHMHSPYGLPPTIPAPGQEFNIDRRANVVNLSAPTQQPQVYRSTSGGGYATTTNSPYGAAGGLATDMNGNIYTTNAMGATGSVGSYAQMGSMVPMYHQRQELMSPQQQQQMMSSSYNGGEYSVQAPATPGNGMANNVAGSFAQHFMQQQSQPQQQQQMYQQQQQHSVQESETQQQEAPSPQQQQQKESAMSSSDGQSGQSTTKSPVKAESNGAPAAPFNPAAMFAQAQAQKASSPANGPAGPKMGNPVAAFLQQQAQKPKVANAPSARPPFNPAAAFAQRFQGSSQKPPMPLATSKSSGGEDQDDEDTENGDKNGAEPSLKKVKPRLSIDAARASAARRMRNSGNGAALAGRGSLDVFLNEIGDVGRLSDLKMDEFQTLDELWRVSDDMNRLSL